MKWKRTKSGQLAMKRQQQQEALLKQHEEEQQQHKDHEQDISHQHTPENIKEKREAEQKSETNENLKSQELTLEYLSDTKPIIILNQPSLEAKVESIDAKEEDQSTTVETSKSLKDPAHTKKILQNVYQARPKSSSALSSFMSSPKEKDRDTAIAATKDSLLQATSEPSLECLTPTFHLAENEAVLVDSSSIQDSNFNYKTFQEINKSAFLISTSKHEDL